MSETSKDVTDLLAKGEGVLSKRGTVWTYPSCPNDRSGTNLVLPTEYVSDVAVQKALADGVLRAAVIAPTGLVSAVRHVDDETTVVNTGQAGSAEMGTELPTNSRVEHDSGAGVVTPAQAERQTIDALKAVTTKAPEPAPEPKPAEPAKHKR